MFFGAVVVVVGTAAVGSGAASSFLPPLVSAGGAAAFGDFAGAFAGALGAMALRSESLRRKVRRHAKSSQHATDWEVPRGRAIMGGTGEWESSRELSANHAWFGWGHDRLDLVTAVGLAEDVALCRAGRGGWAS